MRPPPLPSVDFAAPAAAPAALPKSVVVGGVSPPDDPPVASTVVFPLAIAESISSNNILPANPAAAAAATAARPRAGFAMAFAISCAIFNALSAVMADLMAVTSIPNLLAMSTNMTPMASAANALNTRFKAVPSFAMAFIRFVAVAKLSMICGPNAVRNEAMTSPSATLNLNVASPMLSIAV